MHAVKEGDNTGIVPFTWPSDSVMFFKISLFIHCSLLSKQKAYRDVSREIQDLRCQEAKVHVQHQMLDIKLSTMEDENELVDGIDLGEPQMGTLNRKSPSVSQVSGDRFYLQVKGR